MTASRALPPWARTGVVHLNDSTANIQVWGQPVLNYDLAVGAGTTLRVIKNDRNSAPAHP